MAKNANGTKRLNKRDERRTRAAEAMPEVKALVAKHGRTVVANCLGKIKARDKEAARLALLKKQVDDLEKALR